MNIKLTEHQQAFMDEFMNTQDFERAIMSVPSNVRQGVRRSLNNSNTSLYKAYNKYVQDNPLPPEASKQNMVQVLIRMMKRAEEENDNSTVFKCVQELNKMTKGNLAASVTEVKTETNIIGVIDLTKPKHQQIDEGTIIDITDE
jgi:hypothetical protein